MQTHLRTLNQKTYTTQCLKMNWTHLLYSILMYGTKELSYSYITVFKWYSKAKLSYYHDTQCAEVIRIHLNVILSYEQHTHTRLQTFH